jgi:LacI family gluconate utilization system Gnt-I transcriptional repressor
VTVGEKTGRLAFGATMSEVAALAGVTKMTVSRVLRHPERVQPGTRERVLAAMKSVGYVPNKIAGGLTSGASGLVAAIVPTLRHSLFADTLEGLSDVLTEAGLDLVVSSSAYRTDVEESQIRSVLERRPDALVLTGLTHTRAAQDLLRAFRIPVVETWETADEPIDMVVGYSNSKAAFEMTKCMIEAGYRRIAFVNGPSQTNERARHRAEGYAAAMAAAGLEAPPVHVVHDEAAIRPETGARAMLALREADPGIDAVFFTSDVFAVGAILACRERGIAVPGEMGIAGFHDLEIGRVVSPTLTTVHVPTVEMGRRAGEMILARLAGGESAQEREELGFSVLQRESTRR